MRRSLGRSGAAQRLSEREGTCLVAPSIKRPVLGSRALMWAGVRGVSCFVSRRCSNIFNHIRAVASPVTCRRVLLKELLQKQARAALPVSAAAILTDYSIKLPTD